MENGDLLIGMCHCDEERGITFDASWTDELFHDLYTGNVMRSKVMAKIADGTEAGGTYDVTISQQDGRMGACIAFKDWSGNISDIVVTGNEIQEDPVTINALTLDPGKWYFLALRLADNDGPISSYPSDFADTRDGQSVNTTSDLHMWFAGRQGLVEGSYTPVGSFDLTRNRPGHSISIGIKG